ncbi:MAG: YkgJ family cysteine cluster protein [Desulfobacterota bacterium]|nr:YkgJ family cysteine cluster protein [Thermodesulfobacteriota bacterium]
MGILSSAYQALQEEIYNAVPDIPCEACGQCCVSPHMTLIEFCYCMFPLTSRPDTLQQILSRIVPAHPEYHGNMLCRFQTPDNKCSVYERRALVCRLHGHPVLRKMGFHYQVHCAASQWCTSTFTPEDVYGLMDRLTELNKGYYSYYCPPYWVSGMNIESWLTVLFADLEQHTFRLLKKIMLKELQIGAMEHFFTQRVRLAEKLALIDKFQAELQYGNIETLIPLLRRIQNDFPETGAYYYFEAEMYEKSLLEQRRTL